MQAVIMAGGLGERLRPLTDKIPKPLLPIGKKPILEHILMLLKKNGFSEVFISLNYKASMFEKKLGDGSRFGLKINYVIEKEKLGTAGALKLIESKLIRPFLLMNGDILTDMNLSKLYKFHIANGGLVTVATKKIEMQFPYGVIISSGDRIVKHTEKPMISHEIDAGIYVLDPSVLKLISKNKMCMMNGLLKDLVSAKKKILRYECKDYWIDIGNIAAYNKANSDFVGGKVKC